MRCDSQSRETKHQDWYEDHCKENVGTHGIETRASKMEE